MSMATGGVSNLVAQLAEVLTHCALVMIEQRAPLKLNRMSQVCNALGSSNPSSGSHRSGRAHRHVAVQAASISTADTSFILKRLTPAALTAMDDKEQAIQTLVTFMGQLRVSHLIPCWETLAKCSLKIQRAAKPATMRAGIAELHGMLCTLLVPSQLYHSAAASVEDVIGLNPSQSAPIANISPAFVDQPPVTVEQFMSHLLHSFQQDSGPALISSMVALRAFLDHANAAARWVDALGSPPAAASAGAAHQPSVTVSRPDSTWTLLSEIAADAQDRMDQWLCQLQLPSLLISAAQSHDRAACTTNLLSLLTVTARKYPRCMQAALPVR